MMTTIELQEDIENTEEEDTTAENTIKNISDKEIALGDYIFIVYSVIDNFMTVDLDNYQNQIDLQKKISNGLVSIITNPIISTTTSTNVQTTVTDNEIIMKSNLIGKIKTNDIDNYQLQLQNNVEQDQTDEVNYVLYPYNDSEFNIHYKTNCDIVSANEVLDFKKCYKTSLQSLNNPVSYSINQGDIDTDKIIILLLKLMY